MNIWLDIHRAIGSDGKAMLYCPEVHWNLDDQDSLLPDTMNAICERVQHEVEQGLKAARIEQ